MARTTFTIKMKSTGETLSQTIDILEPEIVDGYWTADKEGKQPLSKAKLGDTVYFQVKTKGIADGQVIKLKLYEQDKVFFMVDCLDPDDDKFPEEEIVREPKIKNDRASVELVLEEKWEGMIADDHDNAFSLDQTLELYWEVSYGKRKKELPQNDENHLKVGYGDKNLFFTTPLASSYNLPELFTDDGSPILMMKFAKDIVANELEKAGIKFVEQLAESAITNIVLTKLEKGYLGTNVGKIMQKSKVYTKDLFTNDGTLIKDAKIASNSGYRTPDGIVTTKGISQYDYFANNGARVKLLGFVKQIGTAFDIFNFAKVLLNYANEGLNSSKAPTLNLGPLTPLWDLAGVLVSDRKAELDMLLEEQVQREIDAAKLKGLAATRQAIKKWNHNKEYQWDIMSVSSVTANKLLQGEFKTFEELEDSREINAAFSKETSILYRKVENPNRQGYTNYIIESFFINE